MPGKESGQCESTPWDANVHSVNFTTRPVRQDGITNAPWHSYTCIGLPRATHVEGFGMKMCFVMSLGVGCDTASCHFHPPWYFEWIGITLDHSSISRTAGACIPALREVSFLVFGPTGWRPPPLGDLRASSKGWSSAFPDPFVASMLGNCRHATGESAEAWPLTLDEKGTHWLWHLSVDTENHAKQYEFPASLLH